VALERALPFRAFVDACSAQVDWASREDDEVSSALRACQRLLHQQTAMNEARKAILMSLVKDRMAYQDYETARDAQERVIEQGWQKRLRTDVKKKKKGKERDRRPGGGGSGSAAAAADAGNHEDPSKAPVSAELLDAVARRDRLVSTFKPFFDEEEPGHFYGLPERSIFEGLEAEVLGDDLEAEDGEPTAESTLVVNGVAATPAGS
jgi:transcriptional adapter 3